ncbi:MAG: hypothetical protein ACLS6O_02310 [Bifidobacterium sp.]
MSDAGSEAVSLPQAKQKQRHAERFPAKYGSDRADNRRDPSGVPPSTPRHAAMTSDVTGDFPAMPTSTEGMDEQTERQYAMALAQGMSLPFVDLNEYQIDKEVISMVPDDLCRRNQLLPLSIVNGRIAVAMANRKLRRGRRCFRNNRHARHRHGRHTIAGTRLHQPVPARQCGVDRTIARDRRDREKEVDLEQDDSEDASPWHAS